MKRFREVQLPNSFRISIEYITSRDKCESYLIHRDFSFVKNFNDEIAKILECESIDIADVISISTNWYKSFKNPENHGKSYKVVGED